LYGLVSFQRDNFFTITQGANEVTIIANKKFKDKVLKILEKEKITYKAEDLASLTITIPKEALNTPGFLYYVTKTLAWENINVVEVVSTHTELTCILREKDVTRAFSVLRDGD